jgi:hypothetical protein
VRIEFARAWFGGAFRASGPDLEDLPAGGTDGARDFFLNFGEPGYRSRVFRTWAATLEAKSRVFCHLPAPVLQSDQAAQIVRDGLPPIFVSESLNRVCAK